MTQALYAHMNNKKIKIKKKKRPLGVQLNLSILIPHSVVPEANEKETLRKGVA
jgi:hypothetical protein